MEAKDPKALASPWRKKITKLISILFRRKGERE